MIESECYECWHDAMAGMWKADNCGWHKMDWYIFFHCFISRIGDSVSFLLHVSFPTGDEKVDHIDTKCILSYARVLEEYVEQLVHAWYRFSLQGLDFEAYSETGMFTIVWLCINWFVNSSLTMERNFSLETALVNVQWIGNSICS